MIPRAKRILPKARPIGNLPSRPKNRHTNPRRPPELTASDFKVVDDRVERTYDATGLRVSRPPNKYEGGLFASLKPCLAILCGDGTKAPSQARWRHELASRRASRETKSASLDKSNVDQQEKMKW